MGMGSVRVSLGIGWACPICKGRVGVSCVIGIGGWPGGVCL